MSLYSRTRGWVVRPARPRVDLPDLYEPGTPHFEERHRETSTPLPSGTVRIDIGAPIRRLASEPQPVTRRVVKVAADGTPTGPEGAAEAPSEARTVPRKAPRDPREKRAITREP